MTDPTRAALSQPEPDVDDILQLAAIIRKVDGNNSLGAAALAEEILSHPHSRWTADRAQRHPQPASLSDEELWQMYQGQGTGSFSPIEFARAVEAATLARACAALAQSKPEAAGEGLTDGELEEMFGAALLKLPGDSLNRAAVAAMRAAIAADRAQRQPVPGEVQELVGLIRQIALAWEPDATLLGNMTAGQLARAADLLESLSPPQPVPVSERLPGPGDCDAEGRCWLRRKYQPDGPTWRLTRPASIGTEALRLYYAEWLPARALPLPVEVE